MQTDQQAPKAASTASSGKTGRNSALKRVAALPSTLASDDALRYKWFLRVWTAVGAIVLIGVTIYLLNVLSLPVSMLLWMFVFIFMLRPIVNGLDNRGLNRGASTVLAYVIFFLTLGVICFVMFSPMFGLPEQFKSLAAGIPEFANNFTHWLDEEYVKYAAWFENDNVKNFIDSSVKSLSDWASGAASGAAGAVVGVGTGVANAFMAIGFAMVIAFWVLLELPAIGAEMKRILSPKYYDDAHFLHITFTRIMGGYIKGMIFQCLIIGVVCGILFAVIGIPNAPALGVITGILNIIPIIGPWLGGGVAAITAVFVSPLTAIIALAGTIVIQQIVYTFISPKIMSSSVDVHPALTLVAMMFGTAIGTAMSGMLGSLVGMLLAIPAVAVMKSCFVYYFEKRTGRQVVSPDGVFFKGNAHEDEDGTANALKDATSSFKPVKPDKKKGGLMGKLKAEEGKEREDRGSHKG